jgi:hypothetical protein
VQTCILNHIRGVGTIAGEPYRQRIGIIEIRQHDACETRMVITPADDTVRTHVLLRDTAELLFLQRRLLLSISK